MSADNPPTPTGEQASEPPAPDLTEVFASPDGQDLMADLYLPDSAMQNRACVIFVHGGGWRLGERQAFNWHAHRLSLLGYLALSIDYRLMPDSPFPAAVEDCQSAVAWVRRQADRLKIDPARIGAVGSSAGGHLVACLGVMNHEIGGTSTKVNCVVDVHGVHDFPALLDASEVINENWEAFLGGPYSERKTEWIQASPALHVDGTSASMLIVHDPNDETVPHEQSRLLADALVRAGRPMQFLPSPGSGHGFFYNPDNPWTQKVWPVAVNWLDQQLNPNLP
ncbi:MAG: hypothetical protein DRP71_09320 [Verrucomicrobia bacterium]|nr:MAG: hypothetical protein DRP71_09320 [Verrucomicrobiota bacterium]